MRSRHPVVIDVTEVRALVPRQRESQDEPSGLPNEVLSAIAVYADRVVAAAGPMDPHTRESVATLLRSGAPLCTGSARRTAPDSGSGEQSGTAA